MVIGLGYSRKLGSDYYNLDILAYKGKFILFSPGAKCYIIFEV